MNLHWKMTVATLSVALCVLIGCTNQTPSSGPPSDSATASNGHDDHDHPTTGPHHGDLIELGDEYHAELVHDASDTVTLYVLDFAATQPVPIDATEVTINAKHHGKPVQFTLTASPDAGDPAGKSSRFVITDDELMHCLEHEDAEARLVISINGKSYRGVITHNHDHAGHDH